MARFTGIFSIPIVLLIGLNSNVALTHSFLSHDVLDIEHTKQNEEVLKIEKDHLARSIIVYMESKGYVFSTEPEEYTIVYIEGMNADGSFNNDVPNHFNDVRIVIESIDDYPTIAGMWSATTEPGKYYTDYPLNPKGAARIAFGQYNAWTVGTHKDHEALVQDSGSVTVYRDADSNFIRTGDMPDTGYFGINQHWGYDNVDQDIGKASAGCLVGRTRRGHQEFMQIIKQDRRYKLNPEYKFWTTIIAGDDFEDHYQHQLRAEQE